MQTNFSALGESEVAANDLGPLAWVLDELRKSLDGATKALRRFVRDAELARGSDLAELDASQLRIARQQLHQAVGALEMVGLGSPARLVRAMEALAQKFVQRPEQCSDDAANKVERASFALTEFLEGVLKGRNTSSVALFPQYRDVLELVGGDRVHPADLWSFEFRWLDVPLPVDAPPLAYDPAVRSRVDQSVLKVVRGDALAARGMTEISLGLASGAARTLEEQVFWKLSAAFFEAFRLGLPNDVYVKRTASRIIAQYTTLAKGEAGVIDRLAQDLLFYCAQAQPAQPGDAPVLAAVRQAYGLSQATPLDYSKPQFGRFDPALLAQARKRIATATETWAALAGGDTNRLKAASEQFAAVTDSMLKLHPESSELARALTGVLDQTLHSNEPPSAPVAMEVATAVLYLDASYDDLNPSDAHMAERSARLAQRLDQSMRGEPAEPLESWMEELYRRVSDRHTMGSVVDELRGTLGQIEKSLDQYFRNPAERMPLHEVPSQLAQMRGVFSVLGLDQASLAALRMRDTVEKFLLGQDDTPTEFERLGNSLGAMGFLVDMLSYQRALAKKLFVYDEEHGEFRPVMGRDGKAAPPVEAVPPSAAPSAPSVAAAVVAPAPVSAPEAAAAAPSTPQVAAAPNVVASVPTPPPSPASPAAAPVAAAPVVAAPPAPPPVGAPVDDDDAEMREIFLEEAREVIGNGLRAVQVLKTNPADLGEQTTLRRAFHTLKGSSRMVGLNEFGEAGWALEQLLNTWLAEQKPASDDLVALSETAMQQFSLWVEDIAQLAPTPWSAYPFRVAADALRLDNRLVALPLPGAVPTVEAVPSQPAALVAEPVPEVVTPSVPQPVAQRAADVPAAVAPASEVAEASQRPEEVAAPEIVELPEVSEVPEPADIAEVVDMANLAEVVDVPDVPESLPQPAEPAPADEPVLVEVDFSATELADPVLRPEVLAQEFAATQMFVSVDGAAQAVPDDSLVQQGQPLDLIDLDFGPIGAPADADAVTDSEGASSLDFTAPSVFPPEDNAAVEAAPDAFPEIALSLDLSAPEELVADVADLANGADGADVAGPATVLPSAFTASELPPESTLEAAAGPASESPEPVDEQIRVIGDLRIGIPLYNVYLNEADEWSRRLGTELSEWELELDKPVLDSTIGLAHSLAGSSATVGFKALSNIARQLELALQHVQLHGKGLPEHARTFNLVAEDIRRLLHQFAAGFLKSPDPQLEAALQAILDTEFEAPAEDAVDSAQVPDPELPSVFEEAQDTREVSLSSLLPDEAPIALPSEAASTLPLEAAAAPLIVQVVGEDHSDAVDALDADLFPIFEEEAIDLFPQLGGALRQWHARPDNLGARNEALRVLHTLKGSARLAGAMRLGDLAHRLESSVEALGSENLQAGQLEPLLGRFDTLQRTFDGLRALTQEDHSPVEAPRAAPAQADDAAAASADAAAATAAPAAAASAESLDRRARGRNAGALGSSRQGGGQTVRVSSQLLDRLVNQAGEVIITRSRLDGRLAQLRGSLKELSSDLDRLRQQLREIEMQSESQMQSRMAQTKDVAQNFDPLEFDRFTRVQELTRIMAESVNDVATVHRNLQRTIEGTEDDLIAQARQARELQRDLLRTRMVEFEGLSERLYAVVRQAAKDAGKQVKLDIVGGSMDLDRSVLERMAPAFEHLLRNAVAHGIEAPELRSAQGKPPAGTITITLEQEGNDVSVKFSDDGAGLDRERILRKAISKGLVQPGAVLSDDESADLIFQPGFSTAEQVTELAGRGVGLDVVRAEVAALGGRIETRGAPGQGTTFKLVVPLTTAVTQVVMLRMGELSIGVPSNLVEIVRRVPRAEVDAAYAAGHFTHEGQAIPFHWGGALLQASAASHEPAQKYTAVVVFRSAGQRVALHVDEVLGNQEVVVKNLGPQLVRVPGLTGMSVLASGAVVLIYNPVALVTIYGEQARRLQASGTSAPAAGETAPAQTAAAAPVPQVPLVLVVDDSITVRRVTQRLLKREGYRVALANDGLHALEKLQEELPTVVLSDIEMPRMDGFDLARNIRGDERIRHLPIIMITSRIAEKHREHARELGVDHYLGKPYSEEELLGLIRHYCAVPEAAESLA